MKTAQLPSPCCTSKLMPSAPLQPISRLAGASGTRSGAPYDIFVTDALFAEQLEPPFDAVNVGDLHPGLLCV